MSWIDCISQDADHTARACASQCLEIQPLIGVANRFSELTKMSSQRMPTQLLCYTIRQHTELCSLDSL